MRVRKVPDAEIKIFNHPLVIKDSQQYREAHYKLFQNQNPIHLEIGMGKGGFILQKAIENPHLNFIGLEKDASILYRALAKISPEIKNVRFILADANKITEIFDDEISVLYLNFSDPWPKNRHHQRRLTNLTFLKKYQLILKKKAVIIFKTDNKSFFDYSLEQFTIGGFKVIEKSLNLHQKQITQIMTEYEKKFHQKKLPIYYLKLSVN